MDNQHKKISGYRDLSQEEIDLMNEAKELEKQAGRLFRKLAAAGVPARELALGRTKLQEGFMWLVRSVAQPVDVFSVDPDEEA